MDPFHPTQGGSGRASGRRRQSRNIVDALMRRELTGVRSSQLTDIVAEVPAERYREAVDRMARAAKPDIPVKKGLQVLALFCVLCLLLVFVRQLSPRQVLRFAPLIAAFCCGIVTSAMLIFIN